MDAHLLWREKMTDFIPKYRGTKEALKAEEHQATGWLLDQVREAFITRETRVDAMLDEFMKNGFVFDHAVDKGTTGYSWRDVDYSQYFHIWNVKESHRTHRSFRIIIRKDGTINLDKIVDAAIAQVRGRLHQWASDHIEAINRAEWDQLFGISLSEYNKNHNIVIILSRTQVGLVQIGVNEHKWGFSTKRSIRIKDLPAFRDWAETVRSTMGEYNKNMKEQDNDG